MENLLVKENVLKPKEFAVLFKSAGWGEPPLKQISTALKNSLRTFSLYQDKTFIGMGRLVGDNAMEFFLKDFVISPDCQKKGCGRFLLTHIENYIKKQLKPGWMVKFELMSAFGKEGFYQKCGFDVLPNDKHGPGVSKTILA